MREESSSVGPEQCPSIEMELETQLSRFSEGFLSGIEGSFQQLDDSFSPVGVGEVGDGPLVAVFLGEGLFEVPVRITLSGPGYPGLSRGMESSWWIGIPRLLTENELEGTLLGFALDGRGVNGREQSCHVSLGLFGGAISDGRFNGGDERPMLLHQIVAQRVSSPSVLQVEEISDVHGVSYTDSVTSEDHPDPISLTAQSEPSYGESPEGESMGLVTALEITQRLKISWKQWTRVVSKRLKGRDLPAPVDGPRDGNGVIKPYSKWALYVWSEIQTMTYRFSSVDPSLISKRKPARSHSVKTEPVLQEGVVTAVEAAERLGITWSQWGSMVTTRLRGRDLPAPIGGPRNASGEFRPYSKRALYVWADVQKMKYRFRVTRTRAEKLVALPEPPLQRSWPEGLVRDYTELVRTYGSFISKRIRHLNKSPANQEDLEQEVLAKILTSDVLGKFVEKVWAERRVTALEACEYLGITWEQFSSMVKARRAGRSDLPAPIGGPKDRHTGEVRAYSKKAVYLLDDIRKLDVSGYFRRQPNPRIEPKITDRGFKTYLGNAVANHFRNCCRSEFRHHKERVQPDHEDGTPWDAGLAGIESEYDMEDMIEMRRDLDRLDDGSFVSITDFDLSDPEQRAEFEERMDQAERRIKAAGLLCDEGLTLREAIAQVAQKTRRKNVQRAARTA